MTWVKAMQRLLVALSWIGVATAGACGEPGGPQTGTETNWLAACTVDSDCHVGSCVCSVCSLSCETDADCPGSPGPNACARDTNAPRLVCPGQRPPGICLSNCSETSDCADGLVCTDGSCVPERVVAAQSSTGGASAVAPAAGGSEATGGSAGTGAASEGGTVSATGGNAGESGGESGGTAGQPAAVPCAGLVGPGRPYAGIQQAIDTEPAGATIEICAGTYAETLLVDHDVTLVGVEGRDATIVDAEGTDGVVVVLEGVTATFRGLTFRGGVGGYDETNNQEVAGGGITNLGSLTLSEVTLTENTADYGGGVFNLGNLTVRSSRIENNSASYEGGGIVSGHPYTLLPTPATLFIEDSELSGNVSDIGGAIFDRSEQHLQLFDSVLSDNRAIFGAAVYVFYGSMTAARVRILGNLTTGDGYGAGAGMYTEGTSYNFTDLEFSDNAADSGGAIFSAAATGTLVGGAILRNQATGSTTPLGAGIRIAGGEVICEDVDFGSGADDNVPSTEDVAIEDLSYAFGAATSVECSVIGCE